MNAPAIQVRGLSKSYRIGQGGWLRRRRPQDTLWALRDVTFDVQTGEVLGIIGRNGAGKSTLLKILSRITEPDSGSAEIHGRVGSLLEVGTGFHPELTGRENIFLNGAILGMKRAEIKAKFDEIVDFSGVERFLDTPVKRYSSGMYTRLAFAVAAHLDTEILLVDEVLAVGDAVFQKKCLGKMGEVAKSGRTILFVSHNMAAVAATCHRCLLLNKGQTVVQGLASDVVLAYLQSDAAPNAKADLASAPKAFADGQVAFESIELRDSGGRPSAQFRLEEPILLRLTVNSRIEADIEVGYSIRTPEGVFLFTSSCSDSGELAHVKPGRHIFETWLSPNHLRSGRYVIQVGISCREVIREAISFEILADRHYSASPLVDLPGHLHFPFIWRHEPEGAS
ncbi:MAG TPA: ABC transporter ATP-binding protein [Candidatus Brocadiia bacterium]|nr:ABC transporter ATP-binding protein [Candidatus Brocadiia bacterium]